MMYQQLLSERAHALSERMKVELTEYSEKYLTEHPAAIPPHVDGWIDANDLPAELVTALENIKLRYSEDWLAFESTESFQAISLSAHVAHMSEPTLPI